MLVCINGKNLCEQENVALKPAMRELFSGSVGGNSVTVRYSTISKQGGREINEDSLYCGHKGDSYCFLVADGLGGHGKGEVASQLAASCFAKTFLETQEETELFLCQAFTAAQEEILKEQKAAGLMNDMKTTGVALAIIHGVVQWAHVGDSRLYAFKKNKVVQRTLDHSVPQMLVLAGDIREKQIRNHPDRNRLLRVIGVEWEEPRYVLSDEYSMDEFQAFLLCSDGFWELIDEKKMGSFLKKSSSPEEWLEKMCGLVEKNGKGRNMDNYTAVAVWLEE